MMTSSHSPRPRQRPASRPVGDDPDDPPTTDSGITRVPLEPLRPAQPAMPSFEEMKRNVLEREAAERRLRRQTLPPHKGPGRPPNLPPLTPPPPRQAPERWLDVEETARRLHISERKVYYLIREGKLRAVNMAKRLWRIRESALHEYLEQCERETQTALSLDMGLTPGRANRMRPAKPRRPGA